MAISKLILNGEVQMDVTSDTVTAGSMLSGTTATKNDGTKATGTITTKTSSDLTVSDATVTAPAGYYASSASKAVASGTAGTPTATKGTVSNHAITVTPSVTNTTGYITGSTKTGTAVTVTASELVSGTKSITENGTDIDVTNYASVDISVKPFTATVTGSGNSTYCRVRYSDTSYSSAGSFNFAQGNVMTITSKGARDGSGSIIVDGETVASGQTGISNYSYTLPSGDISIALSYGSSSTVTITTSAPKLVTKSITANGTYNASSDNADGYSSVTVNVSGGGGGDEPAPKKQINFIDYDGKIVKSYTKTEWQSVTALPSNPSHTGLTAQGWNWTKAQIDAQLTAMPNGDVWVGQMYITTSGDTEIDVRFADSTRLSPYLSCAVNGTITIDWGDNSTSTVTGTSLSDRKDTQHIYASTGNYTITIHVESGSWAFYGTSTYTLLNKNSSTSNANRVYSNCVQNVRIGADTSIGGSAFYDCFSLASVTIPSGVTSIGNSAFCYCYSLASVTIPSSVTSIGTYAFNNCYSLASVTIPSGVTSIGTYAFQYCCSLASITIPSGVTSIGTYAFTYCYSLASITIPSGVTSIGNNAFNNCYSLASVTIPSGVTSIGNNAFYQCCGMAEYHIKPTTPPTLGTTAFNNIQSDCVIYVPSASLTAYQEATNWSTYASYMQGE